MRLCKNGQVKWTVWVGKRQGKGSFESSEYFVVEKNATERKKKVFRRNETERGGKAGKEVSPFRAWHGT